MCDAAAESAGVSLALESTWREPEGGGIRVMATNARHDAALPESVSQVRKREWGLDGSAGSLLLALESALHGKWGGVCRVAYPGPRAIRCAARKRSAGADEGGGRRFASCR